MMGRRSTTMGVLAAFLAAAVPAGAAFAQKAETQKADTKTGTPKAGGILKVIQFDNPPSASIHEEATVAVVVPFMSVFSNLVLYDQHVAQNAPDNIRPELATGWTWGNDGKELSFTLREGVKWHDGKPFTAKDVQCTWDMLQGKSEPKMRKNPRDNWWTNLDAVTVIGDTQVTFRLKRPQPSFLALLATGYAPVYPCHVPPATMRSKPIGTGPFKVVDFKPNDSITLAKNPDYWKPGLPYLDGIEYKVIPNRSTRMLAFIAGEFDLTFPSDVSVPLHKEIRTQRPSAQCTMRLANVSTNVVMNHAAAPFDNPELRRAVALTLDRKAFVDILFEGQAAIGGTMLPPPAGAWGLPPEMLASIPGHGDVAKNREAARAIMRKLGYGPDKRLAIKLTTRNIPTFRDPAVIFTDQLKEIWIDAELDVADTSIYTTRLLRKDYLIALNQIGSPTDDPDQHFYENYVCGSIKNYPGYCNKDLDALIDRQSVEPDQEKRRAMVREIDLKLQQDGAWPILYHGSAAGCAQDYVRNYTVQVNSIYNGWRFEDLWMDR